MNKKDEKKLEVNVKPRRKLPISDVPTKNKIIYGGVLTAGVIGAGVALGLSVSDQEYQEKTTFDAEDAFRANPKVDEGRTQTVHNFDVNNKVLIGDAIKAHANAQVAGLFGDSEKLVQVKRNELQTVLDENANVFTYDFATVSKAPVANPNTGVTYAQAADEADDPTDALLPKPGDTVIGTKAASGEKWNGYEGTENSLGEYETVAGVTYTNPNPKPGEPKSVTVRADDSKFKGSVPTDYDIAGRRFKLVNVGNKEDRFVFDPTKITHHVTFDSETGAIISITDGNGKDVSNGKVGSMLPVISTREFDMMDDEGVITHEKITYSEAQEAMERIVDELGKCRSVTSPEKDVPPVKDAKGNVLEDKIDGFSEKAGTGLSVYDVNIAAIIDIPSYINVLVDKVAGSKTLIYKVSFAAGAFPELKQDIEFQHDIVLFNQPGGAMQVMDDVTKAFNRLASGKPLQGHIDANKLETMPDFGNVDLSNSGNGDIDFNDLRKLMGIEYTDSKSDPITWNKWRAKLKSLKLEYQIVKSLALDGQTEIYLRPAFKTFHSKILPLPFKDNVDGITQVVVNDEQKRVNADKTSHSMYESVLSFPAKKDEDLTQTLIDEYDLTGLIDPKSFSYTITHPEISADGDLKIQLTPSYKNKDSISGFSNTVKSTLPATDITVHVTGIDAAKALKAEQEAMEALHTKPYIADIQYATYNGVLDQVRATELGITRKLDFTKYTYTINHPVVTKNGSVDVDITVKPLDNKVTYSLAKGHFTVDFNGIDQANAVKVEQEDINMLAKKTLAHEIGTAAWTKLSPESNGQPVELPSATSRVMTQEDIDNLGLGITMKPGFKYQISHHNMVADGDLAVTILVTSTDPQVIYRKPATQFKTHITGLNHEIAIRGITKEQDKVNLLSGTPQALFINDEKAFASPVVVDGRNGNTFAEYGINYKANPAYVYTITSPIGELTKDGNYKLNIQVSVYETGTSTIDPTVVPKNKPDEITINVGGLTAVNDLKAEQLRINTAHPKGAIYSHSTLAQVTDADTPLTQALANDLGLGLTLDTKEFTYTYTTKAELTEDGDLTVNVVAHSFVPTTKIVVNPIDIVTHITGISAKRREEELRDEQNLVNKLPTSTTPGAYNLPVVSQVGIDHKEIVANDDMAKALGLTVKPGFHYEYTLASIAQDGTYNVQVFVTMPDSTNKGVATNSPNTGAAKVTVSPTDLQIDVTGVDQAQLEAEQTRMNSVVGKIAVTEKDLINTDSVADKGKDVAFGAIAAGTELTQTEAARLGLNIGGAQLILDGKYTYTYEITETSGDTATMGIKIIVDGVSRGTAKTPLTEATKGSTSTIDISGIDAAQARKDLKTEQERVNALTGFSSYVALPAITPVTDEELTDSNLLFKRLFAQRKDTVTNTKNGPQATEFVKAFDDAQKLFAFNTKYTYSLTTTGLTADGDLEVQITVSDGSVARLATAAPVKIAVTGIQDELDRLALIFTQKALDAATTLPDAIEHEVTMPMVDTLSPVTPKVIDDLGLRVLGQVSGADVGLQTFIDAYVKSHPQAKFSYATTNPGFATLAEAEASGTIPKLSDAQKAETDKTIVDKDHKLLADQWAKWALLHAGDATPLTHDGLQLLHLQMVDGTNTLDWYTLLDTTGIDNEIARRALGAEQTRMNSLKSSGAYFGAVTELPVSATPEALTDQIIKDYGLQDENGVPLKMDPEYTYTYVIENHRVPGGLAQNVIDALTKIGELDGDIDSDFKGNGHFGIRVIVTKGALEATSADGKSKVNVEVNQDDKGTEFFLKGLDERKAKIDQDKIQTEINGLSGLTGDVDGAVDMDGVLKTLFGTSDLTDKAWGSATDPGGDADTTHQITEGELIKLGFAHRSSDPTTGTSGFDLDGFVPGSVAVPASMRNVYSYALQEIPQNISNDGIYKFKLVALLKIDGKFQAPTVAPTELSISIIGLDKVQALKAEQEKVNKLAGSKEIDTYIDELGVDEADTWTALTEQIASEFNIKAELSAEGIDLTSPLYTFEYELVNQAAPGTSMERNGKLELRIRVTNNAVTNAPVKTQLVTDQTPFIINVEGISERNALNKEQQSLTDAAVNTPTAPIDVVIDEDHIDAVGIGTDASGDPVVNGVLTQAIINEFGLVDVDGNPIVMKPKFTYEYTHPEVTGNGIYDFTVIVSMPRVTRDVQPMAFKIKIDGIDQMIALKAEQTEVNALIATTTRINLSKLAEEHGTFDVAVMDRLGIDHTSFTLDPLYDYTYELVELDANGDTTLKITVNKKGKTDTPYTATDVTLHITGLDEVQALNAEQTRVNGIIVPPLDYNHGDMAAVAAGTPLTQVLADELFGTGTVTLNPLFTYTYENADITADGDLKVTITVKELALPDTLNEVTPTPLTVAIAGMDAVDALNAVQTGINAAAAPSATKEIEIKSLVHEYELKAIPLATPATLTQDLADRYGLGITLEPTYEYTYMLDKDLIADGSFVIKVFVKYTPDTTTLNEVERDKGSTEFHIHITGLTNAKITHDDLATVTEDKYQVTQPVADTVTDGYTTTQYSVGETLTQDEIQRLTKDLQTKVLSDLDPTVLPDQEATKVATRTYEITAKTADTLTVKITDTDGNYSEEKEITLTGFITNAGIVTNNYEYPVEEIQKDLDKAATAGTHETEDTMPVSAHTDETLTQDWIDYFKLGIILDKRFHYTFSNVATASSGMDVHVVAKRIGETDPALDIKTDFHVEVMPNAALDVVVKAATYTNAGFTLEKLPMGFEKDATGQLISDYIGKHGDQLRGWKASYKMPVIAANSNGIYPLEVTLTSQEDTKNTISYTIWIVTGNAALDTTTQTLVDDGKELKTGFTPYSLTAEPVRDEKAILKATTDALTAVASPISAVINAGVFAQIAPGTELSQTLLDSLDIPVYIGDVVGLKGVHYTIETDQELTDNGKLKVTITPVYDTKLPSIEISVDVTGITEYKAIEAIYHNLADTFTVHPRETSPATPNVWTTNEYEPYKTVLTDDQLQRLTAVNEWTAQALAEFKANKDVIVLPKDITRVITITAKTGTTLSLKLTDTNTITGQVTTKDVTLNGFVEDSSVTTPNNLEYTNEIIKDQFKTVDGTKVELKDINGEGIPLVTDGVLTQEVLDFYGLKLDLPSGVDYRYSTDKALDANGSLVLTINAIFPGTNKVTATIDVDATFDNANVLVELSSPPTGTLQPTDLSYGQIAALQKSLGPDFDAAKYTFKDIVFTSKGGGLGDVSFELVSRNTGAARHITGIYISDTDTYTINVPDAENKILYIEENKTLSIDDFNALVGAGNELPDLPSGYNYNIIASKNSGNIAVITVEIMSGANKVKTTTFNFPRLKAITDTGGPYKKSALGVYEHLDMTQLSSELDVTADKIHKAVGPFGSGTSLDWIKKNTYVLSVTNGGSTQNILMMGYSLSGFTHPGSQVNLISWKVGGNLVEIQVTPTGIVAYAYQDGDGSNVMPINHGQLQQLVGKPFTGRTPGGTSFGFSIHTWEDLDKGPAAILTGKLHINKYVMVSSSHSMSSSSSLSSSLRLQLNQLDHVLNDKYKGHVFASDIKKAFGTGTSATINGDKFIYIKQGSYTNDGSTKSFQPGFKDYPSLTAREILDLRSKTVFVTNLFQEKSEFASDIKDVKAPQWLLDLLGIKLAAAEKLTYSVNKFTTDGKYTFNFKLSDSEGDKDFAVNFDVKGFDSFETQFAGIRDDLKTIKPTYTIKPNVGKTWTTNQYKVGDILTQDELSRLTGLDNWDLSASERGADKSIDKPDPASGIVRKIKVTNVKGSILELEIKDVLNGASLTTTVTLTGFTTSTTTSVNDINYKHEPAVIAIEAIAGKVIDLDDLNADGIPLVDDKPLTQEVLDFFHIKLTLDPSVTWTYSTDKALNNDGTVKVTIKASGKGGSIDEDVTVNAKFKPIVVSAPLPDPTTATSLTPEQEAALRTSFGGNIKIGDYDFKDVSLTETTPGVGTLVGTLVNKASGAERTFTGTYFTAGTTKTITIPDASTKAFYVSNGAVDIKDLNLLIPDAVDKIPETPPAGYVYNTIISNVGGNAVATVNILHGNAIVSKYVYTFTGVSVKPTYSSSATIMIDAAGAVGTAPSGIPIFGADGKLTKTWGAFPAGTTKAKVKAGIFVIEGKIDGHTYNTIFFGDILGNNPKFTSQSNVFHVKPGAAMLEFFFSTKGATFYSYRDGAGGASMALQDGDLQKFVGHPYSNSNYGSPMSVHLYDFDDLDHGPQAVASGKIHAAYSVYYDASHKLHFPNALSSSTQKSWINQLVGALSGDPITQGDLIKRIKDGTKTTIDGKDLIYLTPVTVTKTTPAPVIDSGYVEFPPIPPSPASPVPADDPVVDDEPITITDTADEPSQGIITQDDYPIDSPSTSFLTWTINNIYKNN